MRVLFDIVHPTHVFFFKNAIEALRADGNAVLVLSRDKDVTCDILEELGIEHLPTSKIGKNIFGLAAELVFRDVQTLRLARKFRPDVMVGFGGTAISHVGKLTGIPSLSFFDSENAVIQNRLTWPFIDKLYVPEAYFGFVPKNRTERLPGPPQLAYLHPDQFIPNYAAAVEAGLEPDTDNFLIRLVAWKANHDVGKGGWSRATLERVVKKLESHGKVHISSELPLPENLEPLKYHGSVTQAHQLLAHCRLLVGESATMASEAAILGVPAIYNGWDFPGYVRELGDAQLISNLSLARTHANVGELEALIDDCLYIPLSSILEKRDNFLSKRPSWTTAVTDAINEFGKM